MKVFGEETQLRSTGCRPEATRETDIETLYLSEVLFKVT